MSTWTSSSARRSAENFAQSILAEPYFDRARSPQEPKLLKYQYALINYQYKLIKCQYVLINYAYVLIRNPWLKRLH